MDIELEIRDLKRRVGDLEGAVNVLASRARPQEAEIQALRAHCAERFDGIDSVMQQVMKRLDTLNTQTWSLRDDLPALIADALRRFRDDDGGRQH